MWLLSPPCTTMQSGGVYLGWPVRAEWSRNRLHPMGQGLITRFFPRSSLPRPTRPHNPIPIPDNALCLRFLFTCLIPLALVILSFDFKLPQVSFFWPPTVWMLYLSLHTKSSYFDSSFPFSLPLKTIKYILDTVIMH